MIPGRPQDLPDYKNPPVTEVVLSFQFSTLSALRSWHIGLLWERLRSRYQEIQEQSPLGPVFETFNAPASPQGMRIELQAFTSPPMPRYWFVAADRLLQIQQDRIIHNWRKVDTGLMYPRYEAIKDRFQEDVTTFGGFLGEEKIGELHLNQCEVTYINILKMAGEDPHRSMARFNRMWTQADLDIKGQKFENASITARWILVENDRPHGRVHVVVTPVIINADGSKALKLEITARGKPKDTSIAAGLNFLDLARGAVVRTFESLSTDEAELLWERTA